MRRREKVGIAVAAGVAVLVTAWLVVEHERGTRLEERIGNSSPIERAAEAVPRLVEPEKGPIVVRLERLDADVPDRARTVVSVGTLRKEMPRVVWTRDAEKDAALERVLDEAYGAVTKEIAVLHQADPGRTGEISATATVPHTDVTHALDCFLVAEVTEVNFVGATFPLPKKKPATK